MKTFCQINNQWIDIQTNNNYFVYGNNLLNMYKEKNMDLLQSMYPAFISCSEYTEGFMIVEGKYNKFGYMTQEGILRVPCIYKQALPYFNGIAIVFDKYFHAIDYKGHTILADNYDNIKYFGENDEYLKCLKPGDCQPNIIKISDLIGKYSYQQDDIQSHLALITDDNGDIDLCEMPIINGFIPIMKNKLWGIQDKQGRLIEDTCHKELYLPYNSMFCFVEHNGLKIMNLETKQYKYIDGAIYDQIWNTLLRLDQNPSMFAQYLPTGQIQEVSSVIHINDDIIGKSKRKIK